MNGYQVNTVNPIVLRDYDQLMPSDPLAIELYFSLESSGIKFKLQLQCKGR